MAGSGWTFRPTPAISCCVRPTKGSFRICSGTGDCFFRDLPSRLRLQADPAASSHERHGSVRATEAHVLNRSPAWLLFVTGTGVLVGVVLLAEFVVLGNCHVVMTLRSRRLANCTSSTIRFTLHVPKDGCQLVLGLPQASPTGKPPPFRGEVVIRQSGREVLRFPVVSWKSKPDNWLEGQGQAQTYFLTTLATLDQTLKAGETYEVTATFAHPPPTSASLWLVWVD